MTYAIEAEGLVKRFKETEALAGVDLGARQGSVLGLLGPNGAGKTTAVRIFATLLEPDAGHARVAGYDVVRDAGAVRSMVGLTGQYAAVDENLTGTENLLLIGRLLGDLGGGRDRQRLLAHGLAQFRDTLLSHTPTALRRHRRHVQHFGGTVDGNKWIN